MNTIKESTKCLASLAVFREAYDSEKDVYKIISLFLQSLIKDNGLYSFNLQEITGLFNNEFDFSIPSAVIKTSIKRISYIKNIDGLYTVNDPNKLDIQIKIKRKQTLDKNEAVLTSLISYIESKKNKTILEKEKSDISKSFCSYLLENKNDLEYSDYISAYIIENESNKSFQSALKSIKEGVVLYTGLKYNNNISEVGSWNTNLCIYLETEIIFHFLGLNGELYKSVFNDFFSLVKEINKKETKINLRYFHAIKDEIIQFFDKAEYIVSGQDKLNPNKTAMSTIVNGCKSRADVQSKKADTFVFLKNSGIIEEDEIDYYNEKHHKYNIINSTTENIFKEKLGIENPIETLKFLNYISIRRAEKNTNNFDNIGTILLSATKNTIQAAWSEEIKNEGNVPYATTLDFLTNKLWYKLNKGFGDSSFPKSFNVISKAQIILSYHLNFTIGEKFEEFKIQYSENKINDEQARARIIELRKNVKKPEEIKRENVSSILSALTEDSINTHLQEQEIIRQSVAKEKENNIRLTGVLDSKETELENQKKEKILLSNEIIQIKKQSLMDKNEVIRVLQKEKNRIDKTAQRVYLSYKFFFVVAAIFLYVTAVYLINKLGWNKVEPLTWILGTISPLFCSVLFLLLREKRVNPYTYLHALRNSICENQLKKNDFQIMKLEKLVSERDEISKELENATLSN